MSVNTICPKQGQHQWSCTRDECICHLKEEIPITKRKPRFSEISPPLSEHAQRQIKWWKKEIEDNPDHPTNMYADREIAKIKRGNYEDRHPKDYMTNPIHGGKIQCEKCNGFIIEGEGEGFLDHQHRGDFPHIWYHKTCYDPDKDFFSHVMN